MCVRISCSPLLQRSRWTRQDGSTRPARGLALGISNDPNHMYRGLPLYPNTNVPIPQSTTSSLKLRLASTHPGWRASSSPSQGDEVIEAPAPSPACLKKRLSWRARPVPSPSTAPLKRRLPAGLIEIAILFGIELHFIAEHNPLGAPVATPAHIDKHPGWWASSSSTNDT